MILATSDCNRGDRAWMRGTILHQSWNKGLNDNGHVSMVRSGPRTRPTSRAVGKELAKLLSQSAVGSTMTGDFAWIRKDTQRRPSAGVATCRSPSAACSITGSISFTVESATWRSLCSPSIAVFSSSSGGMSSPCGVLGEAIADRCAWRSLRYLAAIKAAGVGPSGAGPFVVGVDLAPPRAGMVGGGCARGGRRALEVAREVCCWCLSSLIVEDEDVDEAETVESLEE